MKGSAIVSKRRKLGSVALLLAARRVFSTSDAGGSSYGFPTGPLISSLKRSFSRPEVESGSLRRPAEVTADLKACVTCSECAVKDDAPSNGTSWSSCTDVGVPAVRVG